MPEIPVVLEAGNKKRIKLRTIIFLMFAGFFLSILLFDYVRFKGEEKRLEISLENQKFELDKLQKIRRDMELVEQDIKEYDEKILKAKILLPDKMLADEFQERLEIWMRKSHLKINSVDFKEEKSEMYTVGVFDLGLVGQINNPREFVERKNEFERLVDISVQEIKGKDISIRVKIFCETWSHKPEVSKRKTSANIKPPQKKLGKKTKTIMFWPFTKRIKELKKEIKKAKTELKDYAHEKETYVTLRKREELLDKRLYIINELSSGNAESKRLAKKTVQFFNRGKAYFDSKRYEEAINEFDQAIALNPENLQNYHSRALAYSKNKNYEMALSDLKKANKISPNNPNMQNNLAWFYATCPDEKFRDGEKAIKLSKKACKSTIWEMSFIIDTLAAAYAETGDFNNAVKYQQMAVDKEPDPETNKGMVERLELYKTGKPYREH